MQGMDNKHDGHPWRVVKTTHIKNSYGLNFRQIACVGHLRCAMELDCLSFSRDGKPNEVHWDIGATYNAFLPNHVPLHSTIVYRFCKRPISCVSICNARIYYVVHKLPNMTRTCIHFESDNHHVSSGDYRESIDITKELVR
jgi:hypothetical protein